MITYNNEYYQVMHEDAGWYSCAAVSASGSLVARSLLEVPTVTRLPPPVISLRPQNFTLPESSTAAFPCQAEGNPTPRISWSRSPVPLPDQTSDKPKYIILSSGTLEVYGKYYII